MTVRAFGLSALLFGALGLSACAPIYSVPPAASRNAPIAVDTAGAYKIGPGDTLRINVYGEETLSADYLVDPRGVVAMPMVGDVHAARHTPAEVRDGIEEALVEYGYMSKPIVTVEVLTFRPIFVLGEVKQPGSYPYQPSLDGLKAVALAGGYSPRAAKGRFLVDRGEPEERERMNANEATPLLPGDTLTVRERIF